MVSRGFYRHYKGGIYFVHGIAKNMDEGGVDLVIYSSIQCGPEELRYRPVSEFDETVETMMGSVIVSTRRFERVEGW